MNVSHSTDSEFINKLSKIVEANLADENFGVKELAQKSRISRTQLHRKLKSVKNQSVSQFIREIRLNKAKEMLQQDLGTVSEIAYKVGFGSPSYFIKCFHEYFGYPPGVLKNVDPETVNGKNGNKNLNQNDRNMAIEPEKTGSMKKRILGKGLLPFFGILTTIVFAIFVYKFIIDEKESNFVIKDKSIAVLPLKNQSEVVAIQYLANGIMEDILNRLAHISEFKVKSRISSENYRYPDMSLPEIAKEMDVSYILEGSIINNGDKVRIYVQLIEGETDNHIWSEEYNQDLTDMLSLITDVSKQIAEQLQVALTSDEIEIIEKNYTEDKEAHNLYLLGRYFWHRRTREDLDKCLKYFNQAIELDSNYALAYAGLADTYNTLSGDGYYRPFEEGIKKCKENAQKAINLDPSLAEGHASLGDCLSDYFWDWEQAEEEFKRAIQLNLNFALAYKYYAEYLRKMGRNEEARKYMNMGIELYPQSLPMYQQSAHCYYFEANYEKALKEYNKILEFQKSARPYFMKFKIFIHQGNDSEALDALQHFLLFYSPDKNYNEKFRQIYAESGMNGVISWLIESIFYANKNNTGYYNIASLYLFLGKNDLALESLEKQYNTWRKFDLSGIKNCPDFENLHGHPRFTALLEKMNMADK